MIISHEEDVAKQAVGLGKDREEGEGGFVIIEGAEGVFKVAGNVFGEI